MTATRQAANQPQAHPARQAAREGGYRFPANFGGFAADVQVERDGVSQTDRVTLRSPREIAIDVDADMGTLGWLQR
ncbi:MAG: hypothetical protein KC432_08255 [Thermomicrobiales bacterium]|nr:hypothetical protein [Thermomicrobiales bacterium]